MSALIGSYVQRLDRSHWTADTWAVVDDSPGPGNRRRRKERDEKRQRREPTDQSPGDGEAGIANTLCRPAGDGAARASHPGPHDRTRPPAASGVPVRDCAKADSRRRGRGLSGTCNRCRAFHSSLPSRPQTPTAVCLLSYLRLSTSGQPADRRFVHFPSCDCPVEVEGAPEMDCLLRCGRMACSPRFQLRNPQPATCRPGRSPVHG